VNGGSSNSGSSGALPDQAGQPQDNNHFVSACRPNL